jgi:hypothetical protein
MSDSQYKESRKLGQFSAGRQRRFLEPLCKRRHPLGEDEVHPGRDFQARVSRHISAFVRSGAIFSR